MLRLGILGSTRGTDLQAIIDAIEGKRLSGIEIAIVVSDRKDAFILKRARKHGIKTVFVDRKKFDGSEGFNKAILEALMENKAELVLLIGYMRIVKEPLLSAYKGRIMNIHPSLLPKYAGGMDTNVHEEVLRNKEKETGCTLHFVTAELDGGPIILQEKVNVMKDDTPETLKERVQDAEKKILLHAIALYRDGKIRIEKGKVILG